MAKNNINNKISDHECIDIFIENGNGRKIQNTDIDIFKYNKDRFNNELSAIMEFNEVDNINKYKRIFIILIPVLNGRLRNS